MTKWIGIRRYSDFNGLMGCLNYQESTSRELVFHREPPKGATVQPLHDGRIENNRTPSTPT